MASVTPMMQQYLDTKAEYKDCILFFRLGDFYEMFFDDARTASRELELTLTGKDCGLSERAPMCGVPYHAVDTYVEKLIERGYKVAICEQMEDPALAKGLVKRAVTRIITPGTVIEPAMLDEKANNFLLSICFVADRAGLAFADVSTGEFYVHEITQPETTLSDEVARISPMEIICNDQVKLRACLQREMQNASEQPSTWFQLANATEALCRHFALNDLSPLGLSDEYKAGASAAGALMRYLSETQKNALEHMTSLRIYQGSETMLLDRNTRRNLELTESIRGRSRKGSLLWLLDKTSTAMGGRLLRSWIEQPLVDEAKINRRLDAVGEFAQEHVLTMTLAEELQGVYDIERLLSKVAYKSMNARDCLSLCASLQKVPKIRELLREAKSQAVEEIRDSLDTLPELTDLLTRAIHPDAPILITEGGIIRDGYSQMLDEYRAASTSGKQWILELEQKEREETGIRNLRIQYNRVFGYYIEVSKSYYEMVPARYTRKQTLANCERYMTPELKEIEQKIVGAQEQSTRLELQLFTEVREKIAEQIARIQKTAMALKSLDALLSLAKSAIEYHYVRPEMTQDGTLDIVEGRHPVVEQTMSEGGFVPNDTHMNADDCRMCIITGPNMAGKSTYMRQVALIALMAHIGSFVPAKEARIPVTDRIFTRVGASDDLAAGQSTFMVEMTEVAEILKNATKDSLVILDEIGRGTSTFDGMSIARSVVEFICENIGCKTLFATHYHELTSMEQDIHGVKNYNIAVKKRGEDITFLRRIVAGPADDSYGIEVAKLAGLPGSVTKRAHAVLRQLEASAPGRNNTMQLDFDTVEAYNNPSVPSEVVEKLHNVDIETLTPLEALNFLYELKNTLDKD